MNTPFLSGVAEGRDGAAGGGAIVSGEQESHAVALAAARPGDAIPMMCFEDRAAVLARLGTLGTLVGG